MEMTWSTTKCKILSDNKHEHYQLSQDQFQVVHEAEYLGVTLNCQGVTDTRNQQRITSAREFLSKLRQTAKSLRGLPITLKREISKSRLLPLVDCGAHLVHLTPQLQELATNFERKLMQWSLNLRSSGTYLRMASLLRLLPFTARRKLMIQQRLLRLRHSRTRQPTQLTEDAYRNYCQHDTVVTLHTRHPELTQPSLESEAHIR